MLEEPRADIRFSTRFERIAGEGIELAQAAAGDFGGIDGVVGGTNALEGTHAGGAIAGSQKAARFVVTALRAAITQFRGGLFAKRTMDITAAAQANQPNAHGNKIQTIHKYQSRRNADFLCAWMYYRHGTGR